MTFDDGITATALIDHVAMFDRTPGKEIRVGWSSPPTKAVLPAYIKWMCGIYDQIAKETGFTNLVVFSVDEVFKFSKDKPPMNVAKCLK